MKKGNLLLSLITFSSLLAMPSASFALAPLVPPCARTASAQAPGVECIVFTFINIAQWILGISGSVALLLFVYGGFLMLTSGGNESLITKGKDVLKGALIGLIIVFGAYTGVFFLVKTLTSASERELDECRQAGVECDVAGLLECIDVDTGEYASRDVPCGADDQGHCEAGICVFEEPQGGRAGESEGEVEGE